MGEEINHPMEDANFIQYVAFYANYYHLGRVNFTPECKAKQPYCFKADFVTNFIS